jgi:metal-sulfur cluster biosynthetic enzyme
MINVEGIIYFEDANEAIVAVHKMTPTQKECMLLDMVWKTYDKPRGLKPTQIVSVAYNTSILVP